MPHNVLNGRAPVTFNQSGNIISQTPPPPIGIQPAPLPIPGQPGFIGPIQPAPIPGQPGQVLSGGTPPIQPVQAPLAQVQPAPIQAPIQAPQPGVAPIQPAPVAPPTGLIGAEQSLFAGGQGSIEALLESLGIARQDVQAGAAGATDFLSGASQTLQVGAQAAGESIIAGGGGALDFLTQAGIDVNALLTQGREAISSGGQQALQQLDAAGIDVDRLLEAGVTELRSGGAQAGQSIEKGVVALQQGQITGLEFLKNAFDTAVDPITGFIDPGQQAQILQAALTGAMGPDAQRAAVENFINDPQLQFEADQAERALLRNASATGGLGGGNVRKALVREAVSQAQRQFNTRIDQLGKQAALGFQAASAVGQLRGREGEIGTNLIGSTAANVANLRVSGADILRGTSRDIAGLRESGAAFTQDRSFAGANILQGVGRDLGALSETEAAITEALGFAGANVSQAVGRDLGQLFENTAFAQADLEVKASEIERLTGINLGDLAQGTGVNVANILTNLGSESKELRTQAGRDLATAIGQSSSALATLQETQGAGISDIVGAQIGNIAELLVDEGLLDAASQEKLAILLGNISIGQGTSASQIASTIGNIEAAGVLGKNTAVQTAIEGLIKLVA